jgi:hypothetical protein
MDFNKIHFVLDDHETLKEIHSLDYLSHNIVIFNSHKNEDNQLTNAHFGLIDRLAFEVEGNEKLILYIETDMFVTGEIHTFNGDPLIFIDDASMEGQQHLDQVLSSVPELLPLIKGVING